MYFWKSNMCTKKLDVRETDFSCHGSTEAEVISLDAGLRMDGIPALDLWDFVIEVFHSSPNQTNKTKDVREPPGNLSATPQSHKRKQIPTTNTNLDRRVSDCRNAVPTSRRSVYTEYTPTACMTYIQSVHKHARM